MSAGLKHDVPLEIVRQDPWVLVELLTQVLGLRLPDFDRVEFGTTDLTTPVAPERQGDDPADGGQAKARHTDVTVVFSKRIATGTDPTWLAAQEQEWSRAWDGNFQAEVVEAGRLPVLAIVFESQTQISRQRLSRWAEYVTGVRGKHKCPTDLVVFCFDQATADWASGPIRLTGLDPPTILYPKGIGPATIPLSYDFTVTTPCPDAQTAKARKASLVILAAFTHLQDPAIVDYFPAVIDALGAFDTEHAERYGEVLRKGLDKTRQEQYDAFEATYIQEKDMELLIEPESPYSKWILSHYAEGEADALLTVLDLRELPVDDRARETISQCRDIGQLKRWLARALTATSADEIFA